MDRRLNQKLLDIKLSTTEVQDRQNQDVSYLAIEEIPSKLNLLINIKSGEDKVKLKLRETKKSINERLARLKKQSLEAD